MTTPVDIANLIVEKINSQEWSIPFTAVRTWIPLYELYNDETTRNSINSTLRVDVIPALDDVERITRNDFERSTIVMVGFVKKLESHTEVDNLITLLYEVVNYLTEENSVDDIRIPVLWNYQMLKDHNVFYANIEITYKP